VKVVVEVEVLGLHQVVQVAEEVLGVQPGETQQLVHKELVVPMEVGVVAITQPEDGQGVLPGKIIYQ
jgi:hypothetical protein